MTAVTFDRYADDYDGALNQGLSVSGESKHYFAEGRLRWTARRLHEWTLVPRSAIDYGCGTGSATPYFFSALPVEQLVGLDVSPKSVAEATQQHGSPRVRFGLCQEHQPTGDVDLVFCNGVYHHIPPADRAGVTQQIADSLRPGGIFALWENNPYNPGTRLVMSRIPFDRDAILLFPRETQRLLRRAGLRVLRTDFMFVFPKLLARLRSWEATLSAYPLGAQYVVFGQRR
jgi:SAM-dependent methyltransferase